MEVLDGYTPKKRGWYIVYYAWSDCRPKLATVDHWNGEVWDAGLPVVGILDKRFKRKEKACNYFMENEKELIEQDF